MHTFHSVIHSSFQFAIYLVCVEGDLRLIGGQNAAEGRVELFLMSKWNGVCDDLWSAHDAIVACRQLNLPWSGNHFLALISSGIVTFWDKQRI